MTVKQIAQQNPIETELFLKTDILPTKLLDILTEFYSMSGEMPVSVQKARTEDPETWVTERFADDLEDTHYELTKLPYNVQIVTLK